MIRLVSQIAALLLALFVTYRAGLSTYESFRRLDEPLRLDVAEAAQNTAPDVAPAGGTSAAHPPLSTYGATIARPVFFEGRRHPEPQKAAALARPDVEAAPAQSGSLAGARLRGVALSADTARALIEMPGLPAVWMSRGEAVDGWRLDSVDGEKAMLINGRAVATLSLYAPTR